MSQPKKAGPVTTPVTTPESAQKVQTASEGQTSKGQCVGRKWKRELLHRIISTISSSSCRGIRNYLAQVLCICPDL